jgi:hypothetical protein
MKRRQEAAEEAERKRLQAEAGNLKTLVGRVQSKFL